MEEKIYCIHCEREITGENYAIINGEIICEDCVANHTITCDRCGSLVWEDDIYGDDYTNLCQHCYENYYTRCAECDCVIHNDDAYTNNGNSYCSECYDEIHSDIIHDYSYKPESVFYGEGPRYFGVELEIDDGGRDDDNATALLNIGNEDEEHIYIKHDGSIDDGMEIVSHPMSLEYHKDYCWNEIMSKAIRMGYRSHQTSTCGLHVHVNRNSLGTNQEEQDEVISRILYFVEHHWNELLKFSRRSEYNINRWAARYGYENNPKAILDKAKKGNNGRYAAVNLCNYHTIEFRLFRGTLKHNTFIAVLQLVNKICDTAVFMSDKMIQGLSWSDFVASITDEELIQYLKERRLYINDELSAEEDL